MHERELRHLIEDVRAGTLPRRSFIQKMVGLGLTAPMASMLLMHAGVAQAQTAPAYKPTKRGGGGALKVLWWQGATLLNPHFAIGTKDQDGSRIFYEPLAGWDADGNLVPDPRRRDPDAARTAACRPTASRSPGSSSRACTGTTASRSPPTTCVFNWEYARDPATAAVTIGVYKDVKVEKVDAHTVRVAFAKPTPFWADAFVARRGHDHPEAPVRGLHRRQVARGAGQPEAGRHRPLQVRRLQAGRHGARRAQPELPHAQPAATSTRIEMKGGGDAVSAARAVLQTGEYDYAWNMQVEDEILQRLEAGGKGTRRHRPERQHRVHPAQHRPIPGPRSTASARASRPSTSLFSDPAVRQAMALLVDRKGSRSSSTAAPASATATSSTTRRASARRTRSASSTSTRPTRSSRPRAGRRAPTASARRTARS